jgi:hypothetical protein
LRHRLLKDVEEADGSNHGSNKRRPIFTSKVTITRGLAHVHDIFEYFLGGRTLIAFTNVFPMSDHAQILNMHLDITRESRPFTKGRVKRLWIFPIFVVVN